MTPRIKKQVYPGSLLLLTAACWSQNIGICRADRIGSFWWAMGKFDHTIYFAEIENREDRQASSMRCWRFQA